MKERKGALNVFKERIVSLLAVLKCGRKEARARASQKRDATHLIYDAVTRALYNSLIMLSAHR